jgi:hypothetical protein
MKNLPKTLNNFYPLGTITVVDKDTSSYIYAKGTDPYMLVAHLDTVHKDKCKNINYTFLKDKSKDRMITKLSSPQGIGGDDRCGVILILSLLYNTNVRPSILFTCGEEIGGLGAREFTRTIKDINDNFIIEFDRKGCNDVVRYSDDSMELTKALEEFGFKTSYGSFSDISIIAPHYGVSAVNLSSGYYNAHTVSEYVVLEDMEDILNMSYMFLTSDKVNVKYKYKERVYSYSSSYTPSYSSWGSYYSSRRDEYIPPRNQLSLFDDRYSCDLCGNILESEDLIETSDGSFVCRLCADHLVDSGDYVKCPDCSTLIYKDDAADGFCIYCGHVFENDNKENN